MAILAVLDEDLLIGIERRIPGEESEREIAVVPGLIGADLRCPSRSTAEADVMEAQASDITVMVLERKVASGRVSLGRA